MENNTLRRFNLGFSEGGFISEPPSRSRCMKSFTVTTRVREGLTVTSEPYPHVSVGEHGRGRKLARVALGRRDFPGEDTTHVDDVGIFQTQRGSLLVVKETREDNRALILLGTPAGFRGGVSWRVLTESGESVPLDSSPKVKIVADGYCAQGIAGRAGGGPEYLVIVEPGVKLEVTRRGRLYGADPVLHLVWDGELVFGPPDVVCQAGFEEMEGREL